jgi:hypothetical protein
MQTKIETKTEIQTEMQTEIQTDNETKIETETKIGLTAGRRTVVAFLPERHGRQRSVRQAFGQPVDGCNSASLWCLCR